MMDRKEAANEYFDAMEDLSAASETLAVAERARGVAERAYVVAVQEQEAASGRVRETQTRLSLTRASASTL